MHRKEHGQHRIQRGSPQYRHGIRTLLALQEDAGHSGADTTEFMRSIRLKRAARLLESGQYSVQEISWMVGFNTPRYFSSYFKDVRHDTVRVCRAKPEVAFFKGMKMGMTNIRARMEKQQAARRSDGEREPESFLLPIYEERHQAQNGGKRGQEHRNNLVVVSLDVQIHTRQRLRLAGRRLVVVLVDDVNTGIHHQSAQQDQRGETARPELHSGKIERQERADEGHRNQSDDDERQPERLEKGWNT